jgi:glycosyltransferase involved in cell wall biosynthesis
VKVLQVCQPADGGVAHHVRLLARGLKARGVTVDVACSSGELAEGLRESGIRVLTLPLVRPISPRRDLYSTISLWKKIREGKYSLVHTHSAKAGAVGRVAARVSRTPVVHTPHAWSFLVSQGGLNRSIYTLVERFLASLSTRIICVSTRELELGLRSVGAADKLRLSPNGIALQPRGDDRNKGEGLSVGSLSRLTRQKGLGYLIEAAEGVCAERNDVRFSVAGDGPDLEALEDEIARRKLTDRFELVGAVEEPWEYLSTLDVFVLSSLWEGMPFAVLEAMGCGLPVVATDVGGMRDMMPDETYGTVVSPADTRALKEAILRYVDSPLLRQSTGAAARRRVLEEFSEERMIEGVLNLYSEVARC